MASAPLPHAGENSARDVEHAKDVGPIETLNLSRARFLDRPEHGDPRVVDQHVHTSEVSQGIEYHILRLRFVSDIERRGQQIGVGAEMLETRQ